MVYPTLTGRIIYYKGYYLSKVGRLWTAFILGFGDQAGYIPCKSFKPQAKLEDLQAAIRKFTD